MKFTISPSLLSADFGKLNEEILSVEPYSDSFHFDVMDGHFVPNLSFGAPIFRCIKTNLPVHVHLMVTNPEDRIKEFVDAGAQSLIFHIEATDNPVDLIKNIHESGLNAGVSLKPGTSLSSLEPVLDKVDSVLIMTVEPGFGGQAFMEDQLEKVREIRSKNPNLEIVVDGGINAETGKLAAEAGASCLVVGNYIFKAADRKEAIEKLRGN